MNDVGIPVGEAARRTHNARVRILMRRVVEILSQRTFVANNERDLASLVSHTLGAGNLFMNREVRSTSGRYDVLLTGDDEIKVVLELKVKGSAAAAERQAQKYALTRGIDAVMLVTTSARLAAQIDTGTLGGKPFDVIALRTAI